MSTSPAYRRLRCPACKTAIVCGPPLMIQRLRDAGMLRREKEPAVDIVVELFTAAAASMRCEACGQTGLTVGPFENEFDDDFAADWPEAKSCEQCRTVIPAERIELFPDTKLCVACQQRQEKGGDQGQAEYCSRCGGLLKLRPHRGGGIARYVMVCGDCGRQ